jgi:hypothetical protein
MDVADRELERMVERHRRTLEELIRQHEAQAARLCEEGSA